jgi:integrase
MPTADWPVTDRNLWEATLAGHGEDGDDNPATNWRPRTIEKNTDGFGRYLSFLARHGELLPNECGATRITPDRIKAYVTEMKETVSSVSTGMYTGALVAAATAFSPSTDWGWLTLRASRLKHRAKPSRDKQPAMRSVTELYDLGICLMEDAKTRTGQPIRTALAYERGLMIALLAARPLRIRNFQALELGTSLRPSGDGYVIVFGADEMKMEKGGDLNEPFPESLLPYFELFLKTYRPVLLRLGCPEQARPSTNRLWIDRYGAAMDEPAMRLNIKMATEKAFGTAVWPHLFRDCLITSLAIEQPELMRIGSVVLGHSSFETAQKHYNQAKMLEAGRRYTRSMMEIRAEMISELQRNER